MKVCDIIRGTKNACMLWTGKKISERIATQSNTHKWMSWLSFFHDFVVVRSASGQEWDSPHGTLDPGSMWIGNPDPQTTLPPHGLDPDPSCVLCYVIVREIRSSSAIRVVCMQCRGRASPHWIFWIEYSILIFQFTALVYFNLNQVKSNTKQSTAPSPFSTCLITLLLCSYHLERRSQRESQQSLWLSFVITINIPSPKFLKYFGHRYSVSLKFCSNTMVLDHIF